ncbi:metalloendoproteinase 5-MMP-like [Neltuma alba]|uniref:metalloendoproteinase 5-MMP-like n=1 Tax=Neltuma alba TaxID=207710 RepID=UPI0010A34B93|nr:metalloendoproteinase 5-MMP-like [Prosopis alba]
MRRAYILVFIISCLLFADASGYPEPEAFTPAADAILSPTWMPGFKEFLDDCSWILKLNYPRNPRRETLNSKLRTYLRYLGYHNDTLNSDVQSALRDFQKTYGLPATGQIDGGTVSLIRQKRCGVPDYWNRHMSEDEYVFQRLVPVVEADGVALPETQWVNSPDISIEFLKLDDRAGVIGTALFGRNIPRPGIYLDSSESWVSPASPMTDPFQVDLRSVALHQIGHMLGFGHSKMRNAVMYPFNAGERKVFREEESDNIKNIFAAAGGGVGPGWGLVPTLWLGITGFALLN